VSGFFDQDGWNAPTGDTAPAPTAEQAPAPEQQPEPAPPPEMAPAPAPVAPPSSFKTGTAVVMVGLGAALGWAAGGLWGAGAGALWVGAARNGLRSRAQWPTDPSGAAKTASLAVVGAALGGYLAYRAYHARKPSALE
jgi:hypothetical protein